jgi:hypothetical protein
LGFFLGKECIEEKYNHRACLLIEIGQGGFLNPLKQESSHQALHWLVF